MSSGAITGSLRVGEETPYLGERATCPTSSGTLSLSRPHGLSFLRTTRGLAGALLLSAFSFFLPPNIS